MGIFGALTTAVTGMRAQSFALENISGNIANSQTTAFKRVDTSFVDLIPDNIPNKQLAGNVVANSRSTNSVQGDIQNASVGTFMAINGQGFFVVAEAGELRRQPSGVRRHRPLHPARRLPDRQERLSGQRRRLLPDGHPGRRRPPATWSAACRTAAIRLRLPAGAGHDADPVPRQPGELSADAGPRHGHPRSELLDPADYTRRSDGRRDRHRGRQRPDHVPQEFVSGGASPPTTCPARR